MIVFVILHYNSLIDTRRCVDSILQNLKHEQLKVIVVDNNSLLEKADQLESDYKHKNVLFIYNEENYGFSKGNNIGCEYAIKNYKPKYLCVLNNDTYIDDKLFVNKLNDIYNKNRFDILGPKIWNIAKQYDQNPIRVISSIEEINQELQTCILSRKLLNSMMPYSYYLYNRFIKREYKKQNGLYGAALIFSDDYFTKYEKVFPEITFMYGEENFLNYRKNVNNLKMIYDPIIEVFHNHSAATKSISKSIIQKWSFQLNHIETALLALKEIYQKKLEI